MLVFPVERRWIDRLAHGAILHESVCTFGELDADSSAEIAVEMVERGSIVERLVDEVARMAGETKPEAVRRALESEVWPSIPADELGRRMSREEEEQILGYGREGV